MRVLPSKTETFGGGEFGEVGPSVNTCNIRSDRHEPVTVAGMLKCRPHRCRSGRDQMFVF